LTPAEAIKNIQNEMTLHAGHIRKLENAEDAIKKAIELYENINKKGFKIQNQKDIIKAIQAEHLSLTAIAYLKAIIELTKTGSGSRGSHLVLTKQGLEIHPDIKDPDTGEILKFKPENEQCRKTILKIKIDKNSEHLFTCENIPLRTATKDRKSFEPAWADYRKGNIYR